MHLWPVFYIDCRALNILYKAMTLKVAISSDHAGFALKETLKSAFKSVPVEWVDLGTYSAESVDYPDYGQKLAECVAGGHAAFGVAICGSGIGISIACNRNPKIRAALCHDMTSARLCRQHNDANVLCMGERLIGPEVALDMVKVFLETKFDGGERHERRIGKLGCC